MPMPYMGSKRKSAGLIYSTLRNRHPGSKIFVDLFCGGFAMSEYFARRGYRIIANDKNKYVVALIREAINGLDDSIVTEFVSRGKFEDVLSNKDKYDDWYVGYVMCVWSFGNNQKAYLFGKDVEQIKRAGHELVINRNAKLLREIAPKILMRYIDSITAQPDWHKRRTALRMVAVRLRQLEELERLEELQQLERLEELQQLERLERLQQLERLERLQQLERLKQLEWAGLYSKDYRDIEIPSGAVVYCDPPYEDTATYSEGGFNHKEFWEWIRVQSKINNIYISSYKAPADFKVVLRYSQNSSLCGGDNKNQPKECVFTYNGD